MRIFGTAVGAHLAAREGIAARVMLWIEAKNRSTGATEAVGLWAGDDVRQFTVGGVSRTYYGASSLLSVDPVVSSAGLNVRSQRCALAPLSPEVAQAIRVYEPRLAPVEVHVAHLAPGTDALVGDPERVFVGWIDTVRTLTPAAGGEASVEVTLVSRSRGLTQGLSRRRSDESLRRRASGDGFRRWADVSGAVDVAWGQSRGRRPADGGGAAPSLSALKDGRLQ